MSSSDEELQLHDDEGALVNRKRYRPNDAQKKIEVVEWAKKISIKSAAKKFDVDRKRIRDWMNKEGKIRQQL